MAKANLSMLLPLRVFVLILFVSSTFYRFKISTSNIFYIFQMTTKSKELCSKLPFQYISLKCQITPNRPFCPCRVWTLQLRPPVFMFLSYASIGDQNHSSHFTINWNRNMALTLQSCIIT